jgi:putative ABC transport system permease protein
VVSGTITSGGVRFGFGSQMTLSDDDALAIERPEVIVASPGVRGSAQIVYGNSSARKRVLGTSEANRRAVGAILVKMQPGVDLAALQQQVRALLRQRHHLQIGHDDDFWIRNLSEVFAAQEASSRVLTLLLAAVASVSLVVGGIGIMNIMLVSVTERTKEIGLRMAVGARTHDILGQFLVEATTLSLVGGLAGVFFGLISSVVIGRWAGWPIEMRPEAIVLSVGFSAAVGIFFGYYPARKASRLQPIEALRYE